MVSALDSGSSGPGWRPGLGHCVVSLGKTLYSQIAPLHPGLIILLVASCYGNRDKLWQLWATRLVKTLPTHRKC